MRTQTIKIAQKRYRINSKRLGYNALFLILSIMFISHQIQQLSSPSKPNPTIVTQEFLAYPTIQEEELLFLEEKPTVVKATIVEPGKKFVNQVSDLFHEVPVSYFSSIYKNAVDNNLPPYLSLGIAWQESKFNPRAKGPATRFGTARGLYQIIESTAESLLGIENSQYLYSPEIAIAGGNKVLGTYRNWLSGIVDNKTPNAFTYFSMKDGVVFYKDKAVRDQKGDIVPLLLMTAISYNGGPGVITAALNQDGILVLDPASKKRNIPIQCLDYVLQIDQNVFNFEYEFAYDTSSIVRSKIF